MSRTKGKYQSEHPVKRHSHRKKNHKPVILTVCLLLILGASVVFGFTMKKDELCGDWLYGTTVYSFDGKGKGNMVLPDESFPYTYEFSEDSLSLDFESESLSDSTYRVVIDENDLTLAGVGNMNGIVYELTRKGS